MRPAGFARTAHGGMGGCTGLRKKMTRRWRWLTGVAHLSAGRAEEAVGGERAARGKWAGGAGCVGEEEVGRGRDLAQRLEGEIKYIFE